MFTNFIAKIESEMLNISQRQASAPFDKDLQLKKDKLTKILRNYLSLETQFSEIAGLNSIY